MNDNFDKSQITSINFREKEPYGWGVTLTVATTNGIITNQSYMKGFLSALYNRSTCIKCYFGRQERTSDFTLGDFWGIDNYYPQYNDKKGTSFLLVNTDKAQKIINKIKNNFALFERFNHDVYEYGDKCNGSLVRGNIPHMNRSLFFKDFNETDAKFDDIIKKRLKKTYDVGIVGCSTGPNYGTHLTYYALYKTITDLGYSALMIDPPKASILHTYNKSILFRQDPFPSYAHTKHFAVKDEMRVLNNYCDKFLTGSDQHVRPFYYRLYCEYALLDWVKDTKIKLGYALSFGVDYLDGTPELLSRMGYFIKKFDRVAVREKSGVKLCKDYFNIDAAFTLDPVFLQDRQIYLDMANRSKIQTPDKYIFAHIQYNKPKMSKMAESSGLDIIYTGHPVTPWDNGTLDIYVEDWLKYINNADFILTDSFHCVCFAIILGKQFAFYDDRNGNARFDTLIDCFDIKSRSVTTNEEFLRAFNEKIDYDVLYKKLAQLKEQSVNLLKDMLEMKPFKQASTYDIVTDMINAERVKYNTEVSKLKEYVKLAQKENYYKFQYLLCRFCCNFVFGKQKNKLFHKKLTYKEILNKIK